LPEALLRAGGYRMARRLLTGTSRGDAFSRHDLDHYQEAWSRPGALTAMINWYRALRKRRKLRSERVRVPTMILWGERDAALEFPLALAALRRCDQGRLFRFPNATHWLQHEEPEDVNHLLRAFLSSSPL
jgi:pimeloyl-ACP methyl ester carboxylesterase